VVVDFASPMGLTVTNLDEARGTFFDVTRPGADGRRQVIEPGQTFDCVIGPGPATITFGFGLDCRFLDPAVLDLTIGEP
jgi:hypothetical protein